MVKNTKRLKPNISNIISNKIITVNAATTKLIQFAVSDTMERKI